MSDSNKKLKVRTLNQTRSSIVIKLNLSMMGLLISAMIAINLVISTLFFGYILYQSEAMIEKLMKQTEVTQSISTNEITYLDYTFSTTNQTRGWQLPSTIQGWLPLQEQSYRSLGYLGSDQLSFVDRILNLEYRVYVPYQDSFIQVSHKIFDS
ncbi:MAG: hypothetical protein Q8N92_00555, partial [Erysipelotrichaceae bacterium]|nr:hypothetical protein [Erysipelotrichaceae bacterium]